MLCISAVYAVKWCPSVGHICDFVKTSNRILQTFSPSGIQTILVSAYQTLWRYSDGDPLTGASNAGGVVKNRDSWWIADYWSMTGGVRTTTATVQPAGYCTDSHTSVILFITTSMDDHDEEKRREQIWIVCSSKSEAELVLDILYCWSYWLTRSITRPLCDSRATCVTFQSLYTHAFGFAASACVPKHPSLLDTC